MVGLVRVLYILVLGDAAPTPDAPPRPAPRRHATCSMLTELRAGYGTAKQAPEA